MKQKNLFSRFMASLTDLTVTMLPILVWDLVILIVLAGFLPSSVMTFLDKVVNYVIIVSFCVTNPFITFVYGKTLGQAIFDIGIVDASGKKASVLQLILREFLGGIFILGCYFIYHGFGILIYLLLNLIVILSNKRSRGIADFITRTKVISLSMDDVKEAKKKPEEDTKEELPVFKKSDSFYHYDLHVHSKHSLEGVDTVEELFQKAKKLGIEVLSITDINSVKANYEADVLSAPYGITYIPGIEFKCEYKGYPITILGYNIDYKDVEYVELENEYLKVQRTATAKRFKLFQKVSGIDMNISRLVSQTTSGIVSAEMIVEEVMNNPLYSDLEFLKPYREKGANYLYRDYFDVDKPCYVKMPLLDLCDVIELIKKTNGTSVLAYPIRSLGKDDELIKEILEAGVDGLEVFSPYHDEDEIQHCLEIVKDVKCFVSCGSDYYGENERMIEIGDSKAGMKYEKLLRIMIDRSLKKIEKKA